MPVEGTPLETEHSSSLCLEGVTARRMVWKSGLLGSMHASRVVVMAEEELMVHAYMGKRECSGFSPLLHCSRRIHHADPPPTKLFISHSPSMAGTALLQETYPRSSLMYQSVFPASASLTTIDWHSQSS